MTTASAWVSQQNPHGLKRISTIRGVSISGQDAGSLIGPASLHDLLKILLIWRRLHPASANCCRVLIQPSDLPRPSDFPSQDLAWIGLPLEDDWCRSILGASNGSCAWNDLAAPLPPGDSREAFARFFGREEEAQRLTRLLESHPVIVIEGLPLMGRSSFAERYAASRSLAWIEGVALLDLCPASVQGACLAARPPADFQNWRTRHKLIVLDNVTASSVWVGSLLSSLTLSDCLCRVLVLPKDASVDSSFPRMTLGPLTPEDHQDLWCSLFGQGLPVDDEAIGIRTGRSPGVTMALQKQLGTMNRQRVDSGLAHTLTTTLPLLQRLAERLDELSPRARTRLKLLSLASSRVSLFLAIEPISDEAVSMLEVAELLTAGWLTVEKSGYRIPRPYALAVREALKPSDLDRLQLCRIILKSARSLASYDEDLLPSQNAEALQDLILTAYEPMAWLCSQEDYWEEALEAAALLWVPCLMSGSSSEYLSVTDPLAARMVERPPHRLTPLFWESRGRHLRAQGRLEESLAAYELGIRQAQELGLLRDELWNWQFKASTLSVLGRIEEADEIFEMALPRIRASGTSKDLAHSLCGLGLHRFRCRRTEGLQEIVSEALSLSLRTQAPELLVVIKELQGWLCLLSQQTDRAQEAFEEADLLAQSSYGFRRDIAGLGRAITAWQKGQKEEALALLKGMTGGAGRYEKLPLMLLCLHKAALQLELGWTTEGLASAKESYEMMVHFKAKIWIGGMLGLAAFAAWKSGRASSAAILAGCASHWQDKLVGQDPLVSQSATRWLADCREVLGTSAFQARHLAGAGLDPLQLLDLCRVDYGLVSDLLPELVGGKGPERPLLSQRQVDVLRLAGQGLSNKEIAASLFLEEGTVKRHLHNASLQLGVKGRLRAVARASELGLMS